MAVFKYKNHDVYYELYGEPGQPVLTLVNGLSMRTSHWAPYFKMLPQMGCQVLSYDLLGQGASSKPILGVSFDDHAAMLHALHEHLGIEKPYVVGISFGGVVALKYALTFPERLGGLVPVSTFSELDEQLSCHARNLFLGLARVGFEYYLDLLMPLNFTNEWLSQNRELIHVIKRVGMAGNEVYGIQNLMESLGDFKSLTPELERVQCPTLVLNGEFDALTPRHLHDKIRGAIKNSRMLIFQHMTHAFTLEIPVLTSRVLAKFVHDVEQGRWQGDQSVWLVNEDQNAPDEQLLLPCQGDVLRAVPPPPPEAPAQPSPQAPAAKAAPVSAKKAAATRRPPTKAKPASKAKPAAKTKSTAKPAAQVKAAAQKAPAKAGTKPAAAKPGGKAAATANKAATAKKPATSGVVGARKRSAKSEKA